MSTFYITHIDVNVRTQKHYLRQGNSLCYLIQYEITRQRLFELTDIEYDQIKI